MAKQWPQSSRDERLSWSHHRVCLQLPAEINRQKYLDYAVENELSSRELDSKIKADLNIRVKRIDWKSKYMTMVREILEIIGGTC